MSPAAAVMVIAGGPVQPRMASATRLWLTPCGGAAAGQIGGSKAMPDARTGNVQ